jgi:hypothetical protein
MQGCNYGTTLSQKPKHLVAFSSFELWRGVKLVRTNIA